MFYSPYTLQCTTPIPIPKSTPLLATAYNTSPPMPRLTPRTTPNRKPQHRRFTHFRIATPHTLHWLQLGASHSPQKLPPPVTPWTDPHTQLPACIVIRKPNRPTTPNRIHIRSAVLPQCTGQTDEQTNRWLGECSAAFALWTATTQRAM